MNIRTRAVIKIIFCNKFITQAFKKTQFSSSGKIILKYVKYIQTSHIIDTYDQKRKNMKIN